MLNQPGLPTDLAGVLLYVAENNIRETYDMPEAFRAALQDGFIEWEYAGAWGQDRLALTDKGRAELGLLPKPPSRLRQALAKLFSLLRSR